MLGLTGGLNADGKGAAGLLAGMTGGYNAVKDNQAYQKGIEQINSGDWQGGVNTIAERNPDVALGLVQYKQKADDALALQKAREEAKNTITPYQQEMLNLKRQQIAQGGGSGGFGNTQAGLALRIASEPNKYSPEQVAWASDYLQRGNLDYTYNQAFQKKAGSLEAQTKQEEMKSKKQSEEQDQAIDDLISDIDANPELLGVYSPYKAGISRATGGKFGYTPEELEKRGNLIRQVGAIQNSIIAEARNAGQTGINTIAEIKQATKGLDENSSSEEVKGALRAMKKSRAKFANAPKQIDYSTVSDEDILQGLK